MKSICDFLILALMMAALSMLLTTIAYAIEDRNTAQAHDAARLLLVSVAILVCVGIGHYVGRNGGWME